MKAGVQGSQELRQYFKEIKHFFIGGDKSMLYYKNDEKNWRYTTLMPTHKVLSLTDYLNTFKKENMQTIKKDDLVQLLSVSSCSEWKATIQNYLQGAIYELGSFEVVIKEEDLARLKVGGDGKQKKAVLDLGVKFKEDKNLFKNMEYDTDLSMKLTRASDNFISLLGASCPKDRPELSGRALLIKSKIEVESIYLPESNRTILVINQA